ncbi:MAG: nucleotidyltransferase domain-containing protein [Candidatus Kapabacteria bacterium]|nr:nucleotidyltransferase domain-containing protein [Candidatus Kapabacteria bacterium]
MRFGLTDRQISIIEEIFTNYPEIIQVIIFGSRADGTNSTAADIDLALKTSSERFSKLGSLISAFEESSLPYFVDIIDYNQMQSQKLKSNIDLYGKIFYQK